MRVNAFVLTGLLALSTAAPIAAAAAPIALEWVPEAFHQFDLTTKDGRLIGGITTGGDPQLVVRTPRGVEVPPTHTVLAFEYFASAGVDVLQVFTAGPEAPYGWTPKRMVELTRMPESEAFVPQAIPVADLSEGNWSPAPSAFRIDPGNRAGVALQIRNPVLRPPTPAEQMGAEAREAARRGMEAASATIEAFLAAAPAALLEARLDGDGGIVISGTLPEGVASARLHALEPHELVTTALAAGLPAEGALTVVNRPASRSCWQRLWAPQAVEDAPQRFEFARPRFGGEGRDHLADRYLLVDAATGAALGAPVWVTDTSAARERAIPRLYPTNKKGLGGVIYHPVLLREDAPKLGVTASTVNMKLDELFAPGPERIAFTHQGREWSFSRDIVDRWDRTIRAWTELGVVVSGILLIADGEHPLVHPSYDPAGIFSIANLTTREGADAFRAAMAFVAERYTRSEREHGWITHWIVFNEVDYGWIWTNMGDVLLPEYLETYHRALRLVWLEASLFQESTEVFISLTHNWDYDSGRPTRRYPPRAMIDGLVRYSRVSGDFPWGVAAHPYPENLMDARTWEDTEPTNAFDTPKITPRNIEVLDRYMHQPALLYRGERVRTVLLSEQGFHTPPDYSQAALDDQASAIAYTWEKILPLASIETYHYHRWLDNAGEGGFLPGLRTLPTPEEPAGRRKQPGFDLFSALETERHTEAVRPHLERIGIPDPVAHSAPER